MNAGPSALPGLQVREMLDWTTSVDADLQKQRAVAWRALTVDDVALRLDTTAQGLDDDEAARRLAAYGPNRLEEEPPPSSVGLLMHQLASPLIAILLVASAVTMALGEHIDAAVIAMVILLNSGIGFFQERRADQAVRAAPNSSRPMRSCCAAGHRSMWTPPTWCRATWCSSKLGNAFPRMSGCSLPPR